MRVYCRFTCVVSLIGLCCLAGCEEPNDLGRYCFVGAEGGDPMDPLNSDPNPECRSGLCLKQGGYRCDEGIDVCAGSPDEQLKINPICTHACERNADCVGASGDVNGCQTYVCRRTAAEEPLPVGCLCVCLDYIRDGDGTALTEVAFDASDLACASL